VIPDLASININDYSYNLPGDKIAKYPLPNRDESRLLIHKTDVLTGDIFSKLHDHLPANSLLVLNNTKVIYARLFFRKHTGAVVEIFCLEPVEPHTEVQIAFQQKGWAIWKCMVGNARRWKDGALTEHYIQHDCRISLRAEKLKKTGDTFLVKLSWAPEHLTLSEILERLGKIPLPPYLNREAVDSDKVQYQTVFALNEGSVAAPTAGLHFTEHVFNSLAEKNIHHDFVTLHVGAGTFKPVGSTGIENHIMHTEQVSINKQLIKNLIRNQGKIIAVGTTSVRTLESLYWWGIKLNNNPDAPFIIHQWDPYSDENKTVADMNDALENVLQYFRTNNLHQVTGSTQLMILPGYRFRVINGMVTNFHQPGSTLLLLIAAWLGDEWKKVYEYALNNQFRFLSYGDACLFL